MSIQLLFTQALRGKITVFMLNFFKGETLSDDWNERIQRINAILAEAENVLELKISVQDYLKTLRKSLWMVIPRSAVRVYCKSLEEVINESEFSDRNLLIALAEEERIVVNEKVVKIRSDLKTAVRKVNRECRSLKKNISEQQNELRRLTIENQLLLAALVKMNQERSVAKIADNSPGSVLVSEEMAELKAQNKILLAQNQQLLKTISALVKRPLEEIETLLHDIDNQSDPVDGIVKKLQKMSSKNAYLHSRKFLEASVEEGDQPSCSM